MYARICQESSRILYIHVRIPYTSVFLSVFILYTVGSITCTDSVCKVPYSHCSYCMTYCLTQYVLYSTAQMRYTEILCDVYLLVAGYICINVSVSLILKLGLFSTRAFHE